MVAAREFSLEASKLIADRICPIAEQLRKEIDELATAWIRKAENFYEAKVILGLREFHDHLINILEDRCKVARETIGKLAEEAKSSQPQ